MEFLLALLFVVLFVLAWRKIYVKAGFQSAWLMAIGMAIPLIALVVFLYFVFAEWPIQRRLKQTPGDISLYSGAP